VLGTYSDNNNDTVWYVYDSSSSTFTTVNDPAGIYGSSVSGINNSGEIAGTFFDTSGWHAFTANRSQPDALSVTVAVADNSGALLYDAGQIGASLTLTPAQLAGLQVTAPSTFSGTQIALDVTASATDTASGNTASTTQVMHVARPPDAAVLWNETTLNAIATDADPPTVASRALAMESLAVYDALSGIQGMHGYLVSMSAPSGASPDAAVAAAADAILDYLYPAQAKSFDAQLAADLAVIPDGQSKTDGVVFGIAVAERIIALRTNDGSNINTTDLGGTGVGVWQPTPPSYAPGLDPQWANVEPFALTSSGQFLPPPPPALDSQQYAQDVNLTESLGAADSTTRTAQETAIAKFWNDQGGTYTPPGQWNSIADTVAQQQGDSLAQDALLLAELNVAEADAGIAAWNSKYTYNA